MTGKMGGGGLGGWWSLTKTYNGSNKVDKLFTKYSNVLLLNIICTVLNTVL